MRMKLLASLEVKIDEWLDENSSELTLTLNTGELMAKAAAVVIDAIQEASDEAEEE